MDSDNYLTYEEQFKEVLNLEEISRIRNKEIREIRYKYWHLKDEAFRGEHNISDNELEKVFNDICINEQKELELYK